MKIKALDEKTLDILLKDHSVETERNIIWATGEYESKGRKFFDEIKPCTENQNGIEIKSRANKAKESQINRTREKAEVATPTWICKAQNDLVDNEWKSNFEEYVDRTYLEVSCGESPYLASRYDASTGEIIMLENRVGIIDRKLKAISENVSDSEKWLAFAKRAFKATYGYEWQGDSLLIARENMLFSFLDHYCKKFDKIYDDFKSEPLLSAMREIADIISYNLFQMDGLKCVLPESCYEIRTFKNGTPDLFGNSEDETIEQCEGCKTGNIKKHNGIYARIMDWQTGEMIRFVDLLRTY